MQGSESNYFPESRPFTPLPVPKEEYIRPLSAPDIPPKYPIDATIDEALADVMDIAVARDGSFTMRAQYNYRLTIEELESEESAVDKCLSEIKRFPENVYGVIFRGLKINEILLDRLFCETLQFGLLKYLVEVDLSYNNLSYAALATLFRSLNIAVSGYCSIKRLALTRCGIGSRGIQALWRTIKGSVFIEEVIVNGNMCGDESIPELVEVLSHRDCRIVELGLAANQLTEKGIVTLSQSLAKNTTLKRLQLQHNRFNDDGALAIFQALREHKHIEMLNLSDCDLENCKWAENLRVTVKLATLYLCNNRIDDNGLRNICNALENCFSLRHLDLSSNQFHDRLCMGIGQALQANRGLLSLSLASNKITLRDVWVAIMHGLRENKTLLKLDLSWCELSMDFAKIVCQSFTVNETCNVIFDFNPLPVPLIQNARSYIWSKSDEALKPLSPDAPGIALAESALWRFAKLNEIRHAKDALEILGELQIKDPENDTRDEIVKIYPKAADAKKIAAMRDLADKNVEIFNDGKKQIGVFYGYELNHLGYLDVNDATTYRQIRELILPLLEEYFASSDKSAVIDLIENFKVLDNNGKVVEGSEAEMRTVWQEACLNESRVFVRPSNWISLPDVEEDEVNYDGH